MTARSTAAHISSAARSGERSITEIAATALRRAEDADGRDQLNIFLSRAGEYATARARALESDAMRRENGPLYGVPFAAKDNIAVAHQGMTCGSRILDGYVSPYSATAIERLEDAGAILIGKTNLDEFAMGSSTENSAFFKTTNPWDTSRVPGGSSGGAAACLAGGMAALSIGTDTGAAALSQTARPLDVPALVSGVDARRAPEASSTK